jgi:hypothetical protein
MNNREEFEKWWAETMNIEAFDLHFVEGRYYLCHETERSWMTWQACAELKDKELDAFKAENIALRKVWGKRCEELAAATKEIENLRAELDELKIYRRDMHDRFHMETEGMRVQIESLMKLLCDKQRISPPIILQKYAIPDGYVLVPVEPTNEMIALACDITDTHRTEMKRAYADMIAAAQKEVK